MIPGIVAGAAAGVAADLAAPKVAAAIENVAPGATDNGDGKHAHTVYGAIEGRVFGTVRSAVRAALLDVQPERGRFDAWASEAEATSLQLRATYRTSERIDSIVCSVPSAATLTLGQRTYAIPAGLTVLTGLAVEIDSSETRRLDLDANAAAGAMTLELMGRRIDARQLRPE